MQNLGAMDILATGAGCPPHSSAVPQAAASCHPSAVAACGPPCRPLQPLGCRADLIGFPSRRMLRLFPHLRGCRRQDGHAHLRRGGAHALAGLAGAREPRRLPLGLPQCSLPDRAAQPAGRCNTAIRYGCHGGQPLSLSQCLQRLLPPPAADAACSLPLLCLRLCAGCEEGLRDDAARFSLLDELPFDFVRRRLSVVLQARPRARAGVTSGGCEGGAAASMPRGRAASMPPPLPDTKLPPPRT